MRTTLKKVEKLVMNVHTSQKLILQKHVFSAPTSPLPFVPSQHHVVKTTTPSKIIIFHIPPNGFWECPIHLDAIVNDHVIPKKNSN
jgi:hypothetical protein